MSARHGRGVSRRDPPHRRHQLGAPRHPAIGALLAAELPASVDLSGSSPPIFDQGQSGSCTAHSASGAIVTTMAKQGHPLGVVPSPRAIYAATRSLERSSVRRAGILPALEDGGAMLADVVEAIGAYGVTAMLGSTPDGRNSDVWTPADTTAQPANVNLEPDFLALEDAGTRLITGPYRINETDPSVSQVTAAALAAGFAVYVGFFVDSAFESLTSGQVASAPNESDPNGGGHAVYLSGYDTRPDGSRVFTLTNSWGSGWCNGGRCLVGEPWLGATWDLWICDMSLAPPVGGVA